MPSHAHPPEGLFPPEPPQGKVERRATPVVAVGPDPAAMRFDDRLADCQAHAAALWFRSKERIKYLVVLAWGQPAACVIDRDLDLAVLANCDFTVTTPPVSFIASMPFIIKFMSTC